MTSKQMYILYAGTALKVVALILLVVVVLPALISAKSTLPVALGFGLLLFVTPLLCYWIVKPVINAMLPQEEDK